MTPTEMAKKYYPILWPIERLKALVSANRMNSADFKDITGEDYTA